MKKASEFSVLIIQRRLSRSRVDFFNGLRRELGKNDVRLNLYYGKVRNEEATKEDQTDLDWARLVDNKVAKIGASEVYWQPCLKEALRHDLVIVEQANKLLINYLLIILRRLTKVRLAFWGHGLSLETDPKTLGNRFKALYSTQCDWWFAYTISAKERAMSFGYPAERITLVNNAIDTVALAEAYNSLPEEALISLRSNLKMGSGPVGIFCGSMYSDKRLDFLIESCHRIKRQIPGFEMIFVGSGPEKHKLLDVSSKYRWIHYVGPKFGKERIPYFKLADLLLMPGAVGLAILDSFALQTPLITTTYHFQGPEIDYLENNVNGVIVDNSLQEFSSKVMQVLKDPSLLVSLRNGCKRDATKYNIDDMVANFSKGILAAVR